MLVLATLAFVSKPSCWKSTSPYSELYAGGGWCSIGDSGGSACVASGLDRCDCLKDSQYLILDLIDGEINAIGAKQGISRRTIGMLPVVMGRYCMVRAIF